MRRSLEQDGFSGCILFLAIGLFVVLREKNSEVKLIVVDEAAQLMGRDSAVVLLRVRDSDD